VTVFGMFFQASLDGFMNWMVGGGGGSHGSTSLSARWFSACSVNAEVSWIGYSTLEMWTIVLSIHFKANTLFVVINRSSIASSCTSLLCRKRLRC
jgi:hypothetical protein